MHHQISVHPETAKKNDPKLNMWVPVSQCYLFWTVGKVLLFTEFFFHFGTISTAGRRRSECHTAGRKMFPTFPPHTKWNRSSDPLFVICLMVDLLLEPEWNRDPSGEKKVKKNIGKEMHLELFFRFPLCHPSRKLFFPAREAFCSKFNFQPHSGCVVVWRLGWGEQETIGRLERGSVCCLFM